MQILRERRATWHGPETTIYHFFQSDSAEQATPARGWTWMSQRSSIWQMYLRLFGLELEQQLPADDQWTGAEIRSCCRLAALLDVPLIEAAQNVVPVARTASEAIERLRAWASGRCLSADKPGIYKSSASSLVKPGRKVSRDPSNN